MTQEEQYKSFIKYCSNARKSINNYSDFKRINETIAKIKGVEKYDIYSCVHTKELQDMIDLLYHKFNFPILIFSHDSINSQMIISENSIQATIKSRCS